MHFYTDDAVLLDELAALFRGSLGGGGSVGAINDVFTSKRPGETLTGARS